MRNFYTVYPEKSKKYTNSSRYLSEYLNQLLETSRIRRNMKKHILFEAEILGANHGISYSIFECFSNFQIATKISKIEYFFFDENKIKTFWVMKNIWSKIFGKVGFQLQIFGKSKFSKISDFFDFRKISSIEIQIFRKISTKHFSSSKKFWFLCNLSNNSSNMFSSEGVSNLFTSPLGG